MLKLKLETLAEVIRMYQDEPKTSTESDILATSQQSLPNLQCHAASSELADYPHNGKWPEKIVFVINNAGGPLTFPELVKRLTTYEPGSSDDKIRKRIYYCVKQLTEKKIIVITESGRNGKYFIPSDQDFQMQPVNVGGEHCRLSMAATADNSDYPNNERWPAKIIFILKRQSKPISLTTLVEELAAFEPDLRKTTIRQRVLNNDRRLIDKGIIAATEVGPRRKLFMPTNTTSKNISRIISLGPSDKVGALADYPYEGYWPEKLHFMLKNENAPISFMALFLKFTEYETGLSEKTLKEYLWSAEKRLLRKGLIAHLGTGLTRKLYCTSMH